MTVASILLLALAAQSPVVEVNTLKGERLAGELAELTDSGVALKKDGVSSSVPLQNILEIQFPAPAAIEPGTGPRIVLTDGTRLTCSEVTATRDKVAVVSPLLGSITLPIAKFASIRFGVSTSKLDEAWSGLLQRESKTDLLVVRKEDVLDFLPGVAGEIGDKVHFLIDGDDIPVAREKVYGVIYYRRAAAVSKPQALVRLYGGDELQAAAVALDGASLRTKLAAGVDVNVPLVSIGSLDFSAGKLRYLSQMEPREVKYTVFFNDFPFEYRRDRSQSGPPITLGGKVYSRGISIHSRTLLRYRIGGEFSRFQALMGIDDSVGRLRLGNVHVVISGDGKRLHESDVKSFDGNKTVPPVALDIDVSGVRDLEIFVDYGSDISDTADHLDLADAKLLK